MLLGFFVFLEGFAVEGDRGCLEGDWDGVSLEGERDGVGLKGEGDGVAPDGEGDGFVLRGLPGVGLDMGLVSLNLNLPLQAKQISAFSTVSPFTGHQK